METRLVAGVEPNEWIEIDSDTRTIKIETSSSALSANILVMITGTIVSPGLE